MAIEYFIHYDIVGREEKIIVTTSPNRLSETSTLLSEPIPNKMNAMRRAFELAGDRITVQLPADFQIPPGPIETWEEQRRDVLLELIEQTLEEDIRGGVVGGEIVSGSTQESE